MFPWLEARPHLGSVKQIWQGHRFPCASRVAFLAASSHAEAGQNGHISESWLLLENQKNLFLLLTYLFLYPILIVYAPGVNLGYKC